MLESFFKDCCKVPGQYRTNFEKGELIFILFRQTWSEYRTDLEQSGATLISDFKKGSGRGGGLVRIKKYLIKISR